MAALIRFMLVLIPLSGSGQCANDICEWAQPLELCEPASLGSNCLTDYPGGDIDLAGNVTYPAWAIGDDQWFTITIDDYQTIIIDLTTDYSYPTATSSASFGLNEGVLMMMWYGDDCNSLTPVLHTSSTIGSGAYCGADEYTPNPCPSPLPSWTCSNCLASVDTESPAYIATLLKWPFCCNGWTNQCNNEYQAQTLFYNTAQSAWNWQNNLGPIDGLCPFDPTEQVWNLSMILMPGTYWFQIYPFENAQAGYVSEGSGELTVCGLTFLNHDVPPGEATGKRPAQSSIQNKPKAIVHPRHGLLVVMPDGRAINTLFQQVDL